MQVTNATTAAADPLASTNPPTSSTATSSIDSLGNQNTFLQLLVAQLKNQDPTQPADGIQFVTQLAQFSSLDQLIGIKGDLDALQTTAPAPDPTKLP